MILSAAIGIFWGTFAIHMEVNMSTFFASLAPCFAGVLGDFNLQTVLAVGSACITGYFWFVKMNQERAGLRLYRVADFKPDRLQCSDAPAKEKATWYGEIYLANPASLPAAVVRFQVQLFWGSSRFLVGNFRPGKPLKPCNSRSKSPFAPQENLSCFGDGSIQTAP